MPADSGTFWPVYSATAREFLSISARNYSAGAGLRAQQCHFWTTYLRQLLREGELPNVFYLNIMGFCPSNIYKVDISSRKQFVLIVSQVVVDILLALAIC